MKGPAAAVSPEVLRWARESVGISVEDAAARITVSPRTLIEAEAGKRPLTLRQARKAAEVYERPFATLFLPSPPAEEPVEVQFRRLRDAPALPWPPAMRALAREVPAIQDEADAVFDAMDVEPRWREAAAAFSSINVDAIGEQIREIAGVSIAEQKAAARVDSQGFRVFRVWREAIEDMGVLVLQDGSLPLKDMRGFASPHPRIPAVVINTKDDVRARLFTMLHELAHLFWTVEEEAPYDELAGTTLMPTSTFIVDFRNAPGTALLEKIDATARVYGTTPDATAVRAGWLELAPWEPLQKARREIRRRRGEGGRASGGDHYRNVVARMGPRFVGRVLDAANENLISELAAARLLGVRVGSFDALRRELTPDAA